MAGEANAEHVEDLALVPVGRGPDVADRADFGILAVEGYFQANVCVRLVRHQVVDEREVAAALPVAIAFVDGGEVVEHPVAVRALRRQPGEGFMGTFRAHPGRRYLVDDAIRREDAITEA